MKSLPTIFFLFAPLSTMKFCVGYFIKIANAKWINFKNSTKIPTTFSLIGTKAIEIYRYLKSNGLMIDENDIYIAAIAIVNDCTLVTANTRHFERVEGLKFVNWRE